LQGGAECPLIVWLGRLPAPGVVNLTPGPATLPTPVIKMRIILWVVLVFLVFSFIGIVVLGDLLRYRDLQRRLRAESEEG